MLRVVEGFVAPRDRLLTAPERENQMLVCVSRAADDHLVVDL
jgi:hypothetical protein